MGSMGGVGGAEDGGVACSIELSLAVEVVDGDPDGLARSESREAKVEPRAVRVGVGSPSTVFSSPDVDVGRRCGRARQIRRRWRQ